jgi:hypothetical protein
MRTTSLVLVGLLVLSLVPGVFAVSVGSGITPDITTEDFAPQVWMCDGRVVLDDATEPGRVSDDGDFLVERINNYAFEGEQIVWEVLVLDKNGIEKVQDVYVTVEDTQGEGNPIEANCVLNDVLDADDEIDPSCNARILEEELETPGYDNVAATYTCTFTVESPATGMYGEYFLTVEAQDLDGLMGTMDENEYWFLNPVYRLSIDV